MSRNRHRFIYNEEGSSVDLVRSRQELRYECILQDGQYLKEAFRQTLAQLKAVIDERDDSKANFILANIRRRRIETRLKNKVENLEQECDFLKEKHFKTKLELFEAEEIIRHLRGEVGTIIVPKF